MQRALLLACFACEHCSGVVANETVDYGDAAAAADDDDEQDGAEDDNDNDNNRGR